MRRHAWLWHSMASNAKAQHEIPINVAVLHAMQKYMNSIEKKKLQSSRRKEALLKRWVARATMSLLPRADTDRLNTS